MSSSEITAVLSQLFERWAEVPSVAISELGANGSNRRYFRMQGGGKCCIAAFNDDVRENDAFLYYSDEMRKRGLPVPEVYAVSDDRRCYLQQDLGDETLYAHLYAKRQQGGGFDDEMLTLYRQVLGDLADFQTRCRDLDFIYAYPRSDFDRQSMQWDLQYFKYYFLKLLHVPFDEQLLENDFNRLIEYLLQEDCRYFMYRDFQSRNIMLLPTPDETGCRLYYIDYQGGRRGAAQYDVASLLYSAKSDIPDALRRELLEHYIRVLSDKIGAMPADSRPQFSADGFRKRYYGYVLIRIMQALGAYGYRGYFERKTYFLQSIPLALTNLRRVVEDHWPPVEMPHLRAVLDDVAHRAMAAPPVFSADRLTVTVMSFSYKKGLPEDESGNGGGFVFDCRALPNPGRYEQYKTLTGRDVAVVQFLGGDEAVESFLTHAATLVRQSVKQYSERHFSHLMVSFGCTGGQHRSVYCAERMAAQLRSDGTCHVRLIHREQEIRIED